MTHQHLEEPQHEQAAGVLAIIQFLTLLRRRYLLVLGVVVLCVSLGVIYFVSQPPVYEAKASLLVSRVDGEFTDTSLAGHGAIDGHIPTYVELLTSTVVLRDALTRLEKAAPQFIEFSGPSENWPDAMKSSLRADAKRRTNIIDVYYRAGSARSAELHTESVIRAYTDFIQQHHRDVSLNVLNKLETERKEVALQLTAAQTKSLDLRRRVKALGIREDKTLIHPFVQRVVSLNERLIEVQNDRIRLQASMSAIQGAIQEGRDLREHLLALDPKAAETLITTRLGLAPQSKETVAKVESELREKEAVLASQMAHLGPSHAAIRQLQQEVAGVREFLNEYQSRVNERLDAASRQELANLVWSMSQERLATVVDQEQRLLAEYEGAEARAIELNDQMTVVSMADREVERLSTLHNTLQTQIASLDINQDHVDVRVAVVRWPRANTAPVWPSLPKIGLISLVLGFGFAAGLVYLLDILDDRFRNPEEISSQLGVPILALVREISIDPKSVGLESLVTHVAPSSVEAEAFRTLRAALAFSGHEVVRLAVTSSEPGDGKTTIISNLAMAFAQANRRTLLIDADLRRPGLSTRFALRREQGLSTLLSRAEPIEDGIDQIILSSGVPNLDILPSGPKPANPAELFSGDRMGQLMAWADGHYDQVLVDVSPISASSDAMIVGRNVDAAMMVVQPRKNNRRHVLHCAKNLTSMSVDLIGVAVNRADKVAANGYGYGFGYGYGTGYGYGEDEIDEVDAGAPPAEYPRAA